MNYHAAANAVVELPVIFPVAIAYVDITGPTLIANVSVTAVTHTVAGVAFLDTVAQVAILKQRSADPNLLIGTTILVGRDAIVTPGPA